MTDNLTIAQRRRCMRSVRTAATAPELTVRAILRRAGIYFAVNNRKLPGKPDLANRTRGWALFVHGCFWHGHNGCARATMPVQNRAFWKRKIAANRSRDFAAIRALRQLGLRVFVIWQCELRRPGRVLGKVVRALDGDSMEHGVAECVARGTAMSSKVSRLNRARNQQSKVARPRAERVLRPQAKAARLVT